MKSSFRYLLAAVVSTIIWGFFSIPLRQLQAYTSEDILIYRVFISLLAALFICIVFRRKSFSEDLTYLRMANVRERRRIIQLIVFSSIFITANWFSFIYVVNHVSLQSAAFAYMVCPIITALSAYLILKEPLSRIKWIAIFISFISISILASQFYRGVLFSVLIAGLYTVYLLMQKKIEGISKFNIVVVQLSISALLVLPFYLLHYHAAPAELHFWIYITIVSLFFTLLPLFLSLYALIRLPSSTVGIIIYLNPIIAFLVAIFYFHEPVSISQVIAYLVLLIAVIIFNWEFLQRNMPGKKA